MDVVREPASCAGSGNNPPAPTDDEEPKQQGPATEPGLAPSCSCGRSSSGGSSLAAPAARAVRASHATPPAQSRATRSLGLSQIQHRRGRALRCHTTSGQRCASNSAETATRATTDFDAESSVVIEMGEDEKPKKKVKQKPAWRHNPTAEEEPDQKECRMCLAIDDQEDIISVCNCSGTQAWMHYGCLKLWVRERKLLTCELCHAPYAEPYMGLLKEEIGKNNRGEHAQPTFWLPDIETGYGAGVFEFGGLARTDPSTWPPAFSRQISNTGTLSSEAPARRHRPGDCECQCCECCDCDCCHRCDSGAVSAVIAITGFIIFLIIIAAVGSAAG